MIPLHKAFIHPHLCNANIAPFLGAWSIHKLALKFVKGPCYVHFESTFHKVLFFSLTTIILLWLTNTSAKTDATFSVEYSRERFFGEFSQASIGRTMAVHVPWCSSSINLPWSPQKLFTMAYRIYTEIPERSLLQTTRASPWLREDLSRDFSIFNQSNWLLFFREHGALRFRLSYCRWDCML